MSGRAVPQHSLAWVFLHGEDEGLRTYGGGFCVSGRVAPEQCAQACSLIHGLPQRGGDGGRAWRE